MTEIIGKYQGPKINHVIHETYNKELENDSDRN